MTRARTLRPLALAVLALAATTAAWTARPAPDVTPGSDVAYAPDVAPASATIRIHLAGGAVHVTPASVTIKPGDEIIWESELPFAVDVERSTALFGRALPPAALRGRANAPARVNAGASAPAGSYKYSVGVWDGTNVWVVDPEIIISPN